MKKMIEKEYKFRGEVRKRYPIQGRKGRHVGDLIGIDITERKFGGHNFIRALGHAGWKAIIVERYITINSVWRNPHTRVKILEGPYEGKVVCIQ